MESSLGKERERSTWSKLYLTAYNGLQALGWSYITVQTFIYLLRNKTAVGLWSNCSSPLMIFQTLAVLEVFHCLLGLVPSGAYFTFCQVLSRVFHIWGVLHPIKEVQNLPSVAIVFVVWGITEVTRYSFYCTNLYGKSPRFLTWCRYSFFLVLYPLGVYGEQMSAFQGLSYVKNSDMYSIALPNVANISFSFYYFYIEMMLSCFPTFPRLYLYMCRQRAKVFSATKAPDSPVSKPNSSKKMS